jgi:adenylosuccinate lyase
MIPRYEKTEISNIWSEENKFSSYLKVELAILKAQEGDKIPKGTSEKIAAGAVINPTRIGEIEKVTRHDIIAFCSSITENLDPQVGKYFHFGVTSSDVIDSALMLQIKDSLDFVIPALEEATNTLLKRANEMKDVVTIGRSHGMYAEPMSFGVKLLGHAREFQRRLKDYKDFYESELTIQFSGAVGNYTIVSPEAEKKAADELNMKVESVSTQVIPRDRIAKLVTLGGLLAGAIERISVEIRHLHRSEVSELHEGFAKGQKGSSTMPHKKNPISGENLTGMSRFLRSHVSMALENSVLWHERDISHSSAERMYLPDHFGILLYSLNRLNSTIENLVFHPEVIEKRVMENFTYLSSYYLHYLIEKTDFTRERLYELVQTASFEGNKSGKAEDFHNSMVTQLKTENIEINIPTPTFSEVKNIYLKHTDKIFNRGN